MKYVSDLCDFFTKRLGTDQGTIARLVCTIASFDGCAGARVTHSVALRDVEVASCDAALSDGLESSI